jgi:hypothetical protein
MFWWAYWARCALVGNVIMLLIKRGFVQSSRYRVLNICHVHTTDIHYSGPYILQKLRFIRLIRLPRDNPRDWLPHSCKISVILDTSFTQVGSYPVKRGCGNLIMDSHSQGHERKVLFTLLVAWWNHDSLSLHTQNLHSAHKFDCVWFSPQKSKDVKHQESYT